LTGNFFSSIKGSKGPAAHSSAFLLIFFVYALVCLLGALPYYFSGCIPRFTDAVFESVSGFTTTGLTVLRDIESALRPLLFWRALTQWLGGLGVLLFITVLLPSLGTGGFQIFSAEAPGPGTEKITPRINRSARSILLVYMGLTAAEALLLRCFGMNWFDAVTHAFSTMSTGGFRLHNDGVAFYRSPSIEWVLAAFMFLAGFNYVLIWRMFRGNFSEVLRNSEAKVYTTIVVMVSIVIAIVIVPVGNYPPGGGGRNAFFNTVSILSTTGFSCADTGAWPTLVQGLLFFLMFFGGCSLSAAGGVKIVRYIILAKQAGNEMKKIVHPRGVYNIRLDGKSGKKEVVYGVAGFVFLYFLLLFLCALLLSSAGEDIFSSLKTALACLGNIGFLYPLPHFPAYVTWGLALTMIIGRLELWVVLVFFTRDFWKL
jgi:trk system potassium uptake protein TrkH